MQVQLLGILICKFLSPWSRIEAISAVRENVLLSAHRMWSVCSTSQDARRESLVPNQAISRIPSDGSSASLQLSQEYSKNSYPVIQHFIRRVLKCTLITFWFENFDFSYFEKFSHLHHRLQPVTFMFLFSSWKDSKTMQKWTYFHVYFLVPRIQNK